MCRREEKGSVEVRREVCGRDEEGECVGREDWEEVCDGNGVGGVERTEIVMKVSCVVDIVEPV